MEWSFTDGDSGSPHYTGIQRIYCSPQLVLLRLLPLTCTYVVRASLTIRGSTTLLTLMRRGLGMQHLISEQQTISVKMFTEFNYFQRMPLCGGGISNGNSKTEKVYLCFLQKKSSSVFECYPYKRPVSRFPPHNNFLSIIITNYVSKSRSSSKFLAR
jgi:hypothetical protein